MNRYTLTLDGLPLPLTPDTVIRPTLAGTDLADLTKTPSAYSNELSIPYTPEVAARLGFAAHPQAVTSFPYDVPAQAAAYYDGVPLMAGAVLSITGIEGRVLKGNLFQGALSLFETLGDKSVRGLATLGSLTWDAATLATGADRAAGWVATIEDRGRPVPTYSADDAEYYEARFVYPATFLHSVVTAILAEAGWSMVGWANPEYPKLVLPFSLDRPRRSDTATEALKGVFSPLATGPTGGTYTWLQNPLPARGRLRVTVVMNIDFTGGDPAASVTLQVGAFYDGATVQLDAVAIRRGLNQQYEVSIEFDAIFESDLSLWAVTAAVSVIVPTGTAPTVAPMLVSMAYEYTEALPFGETWELAANLPDLKQTDLLKTVFQLYGLAQTYDPVARTLRLIELPTAVAQTPQDWSSKIAAPKRIGEPDSVAWELGDYARVNAATWDADDANGADFATYGNGSLPATGAQLDASNDWLTMPFAASPPGNAAGGATVRVPSFKRTVNTNNYTDRSIKPRLAVLTEDTATVKLATIDITGYTLTGGVLVPSIDLTYQSAELRALAFAPLLWPARLDAYYGPLRRVLESPYVGVHGVKLSAADLYGVDFTKPVFAFGRLFFLNSLDTANPAGLTDATLIRLA